MATLTNLRLVDLNSLIDNLPDVCHQPVSSSFPKREYGKSIIC